MSSASEGDVFIDVGAHIGKYTLSLARKVGLLGRVVAIEPDPINFKALAAGIAINKLKNVTALNIAAFDRECKLPLYVAPDEGRTPEGWLFGKGGSSINRKEGRLRHEVAAKPLDKVAEDLRLSDVNYVKIDVEGAEYEVLKGSKKLFEKYRPKIVAECTSNLLKVFKLMKELGYDSELIAPSYYFFEPHQKATRYTTVDNNIQLAK